MAVRLWQTLEHTKQQWICLSLGGLGSLGSLGSGKEKKGNVEDCYSPLLKYIELIRI